MNDGSCSYTEQSAAYSKPSESDTAATACRERAGTRLTRALNSADPSSSKKKRQCGNLAEPREFSQALLVPMHRGREGVAATREELGVRWLLPVLKVLQVVDERLLLEVSMLGQDCIRRPD